MAQNTPKDEKWLLRRLDQLEKRVASLETSPRAGNTSISGGVFTVGDPTGDNQIELDAGEGNISFTRSGQPAGRLLSLNGVGGGAELEGSAAPGDVLPFGTDAQVQITGIDSTLQASAQDWDDPDTTTSLGQVRASFVYNEGTQTHAPQISIYADSDSDPDSAQVFMSASGGLVFSAGRTTDAAWAGSVDTVVLYVKAGRLYYRDGNNVVRGPL